MFLTQFIFFNSAVSMFWKKNISITTFMQMFKFISDNLSTRNLKLIGDTNNYSILKHFWQRPILETFLTQIISLIFVCFQASTYRHSNLHVPIVLKSGSLNLLEPSGPVQACNGIAICLPLHIGPKETQELPGVEEESDKDAVPRLHSSIYTARIYQRKLLKVLEI
jgi:hypothetical protein